MRPRVVLLDVLGTMLGLEPPAPALRTLLRERFGIEVTERQAEAAMAAEIAYYRRNLGEGSGAASVAELRRRSGLVVRDALVASDELGPAGALAGIERIEPDQLVALLLDALEFVPFPDVRPALASLSAAGVRLVAVSNWDASLPDTLAGTGLLDLLDGVVCSAVCGAAKPDPLPFTTALRLVDASPGEAVHVGDSVVEDVQGAVAAGIVPLLLVREQSGIPASVAAPACATVPAGIASIGSLAELPGLVLGSGWAAVQP